MATRASARLVDAALELELEQAPAPAIPWESTRCRCCGRLLCKNTRDALRPECVIEIKCGDCKTLNYLMGRPE